MKLNSDLFWELCKEYDVPLSQDYNDVMFEDEYGNVRTFRDEDIDRIFASEDGSVIDNAEYEEAKFCIDVPAVITPLLSDEFLLAA